MADYVKTGPFTNGSAPGISAAFLNAIENVFVQPSGGSEVGKYFIEGGTYTINAYVSIYIPTLSRGATILSVTHDHVDGFNTANAEAADSLSAYGFRMKCSGTGTSTDTFAGGNWTANF